MAIDIKIGDKVSSVNMLEKNGRFHKISIDNKVYDVDLLEVEKGVYSIIYKDKSFNVELSEGNNAKSFEVNTLYNSYDVDILDAEAKYINSRKSDELDDGSVISSPMPGKVVKILVKVGDKLKAGDTVIIISAMKMESEYKVKKDRIVKAIKVKEGDTIDGNQPLIIIE